MRRTAFLPLAMCLAVLTGCGLADSVGAYIGGDDAEPVADIATLGYVPQFDYTYDEQTTRVITDTVGYSPTGKKVLYIEGTDIDKSFRIIDISDGETVYEGRLRRVSDDKGNTENAPMLYMGDFTEFSGSGSYRAYQPDVGYSDEFTIYKDIHRALYDEVYRTIMDAEYMQTSALIYTLSNLMFTHEIYENAYTNDAFIRGGIEVLLAQQHPRNGAVYQELQDEETLRTITDELRNPSAATIQTDTMISLSATAELAGVLAQYYCDYYETEQESAVSALRAAAKAYSYIERYKDGVASDSLYYAACELYRATGQLKYRNAIAEYDNIPEQSVAMSDYDYTMLADVAYLSSGYRTDYNRCEKLMAHYRGLAAEISGSASRQTYYVQADIGSLTEDEILYNMMTLGLVSYILSGREYASVQANYLHYLFGINPSMSNYYTEPVREGNQPLCNDIVRLSKLIFILGNGE